MNWQLIAALGAIGSGLILAIIDRVRSGEAKTIKYLAVCLILVGGISAAYLVVEVEGQAKETATEVDRQRNEEQQRNREVMEAIRRTANPIDRIVIWTRFQLPMDALYVAAYRKKIDTAFTQFSKMSKAAQDRVGKEKMAFVGLSFGGKGGDESGSIVMTQNHPDFPRIPPWEIQLDFYRRPINLLQYEPSALSVVSTRGIARKFEPDLSVGQLLTKPGWMLLVKVPVTRNHYEAWLPGWNPPKVIWRQNTDKVGYLADLVGSQLFISIGSIKQPSTAKEFFSKYELRQLRILVNSNMQLSVSAEKTSKHLTAEGVPFWVYTFPATYDELFTTSDAQSGASGALTPRMIPR